MFHHVFGPHFLGAPLFPGLPNWLLLILLAVALWYFFGRSEQAQTEPSAPQAGGQGKAEKKGEDYTELRQEIERLRAENKLLQQLLEKELRKQ